MSEINEEKYVLQGSFNGKDWVDLTVIPYHFLTFTILQPHSEYSHFRTKSLLTKEVLSKAYNPGGLHAK